MTREKSKTKTEEKKETVVKAEKKEEKKEEKTMETKTEEKKETKTEEKKETKTEEKKETKAKKVEPKKEIPKKEEAVSNGSGLHLSKKHCMYICKFIKNKKIDDAIEDLRLVIKMKKLVPFKGEIPHKKGKGMMSGRYPVKAAGMFINMLKSLKGNVIVNKMDLDKTKIYFASASWASRPMRSGGRQGKRSNVILKARETGGKK